MKVGDVASEFAIRNLVARYSEAVTRRNEARFAETWAEDAQWHIIGNHATGRDDIVALWKKLIAGFPFIAQLLHGGHIEVDGDTARGGWTITEVGQGVDGSALYSLGLYRDEYCCRDGVWRFANRTFEALYMGPPDLGATFNAATEEE